MRLDEAHEVAGELLLILVLGFVVIAVRPVSQRQIRPASMGEAAQMRDPTQFKSNGIGEKQKQNNQN